MIPDELKNLRQWVVAEADKVPRNPRTLDKASVTDPKSWGTYEQALAAKAKHIGFVLTKNDPYAFIDLDAPQNEEQIQRHNRVLELFDSYTEISQSGNGVHILLRGAIPAGARRDKIEVYSDARYLIMTGRVVRNVPIRDYSELFFQLYTEMGNGGVHLTDLHEYDEVISDRELVEMAERAVNGEKYLRLARGEWQGEYPSQSEADFAFLSMLAFYTRSNEQVMRLFRYSALGKRDKALRDDYLLRCLKKIRANEPPPIDFGAFLLQNSGMPTGVDHANGRGDVSDGSSSTNRNDVHSGDNFSIRNRHPVDASLLLPHSSRGIGATPDLDYRVSSGSSSGVHSGGAVSTALTYPPGLVGDIARYIHDSSPRPVPEVAIAAALALCAGVAGRQYNISNTGLNLYVILLAKTGIGKEGGPQGIERILAETRKTIPIVDGFLGPAHFGSGQALIRALDKQQCFVSVLGEFGIEMQMISDPRAPEHRKAMKRFLLALYNKSGRDQILQPTAYSDSQKNTATIRAPALTIFGESTPETFYEGLSAVQIKEGLIPRFLIIEYLGERTEPNPNAFVAPSESLLARFAELVTTVAAMQANQSWLEVPVEVNAQQLLDNFNSECDHRMYGQTEAVRQLWNRAHFKAMRIAALLAVADRPSAPVVSTRDVEWALQLVRHDVETILLRFEEGDVGHGESQQVAVVKKLLKDYVEKPYEAFKGYQTVTPQVHRDRVIPVAYLQNRLQNIKAFYEDRRSLSLVLKDVLHYLEEAGVIQELNKEQKQERYNCRRQLFRVL